MGTEKKLNHQKITKRCIVLMTRFTPLLSFGARTPRRSLSLLLSFSVSVCVPSNHRGGAPKLQQQQCKARGHAICFTTRHRRRVPYRIACIASESVLDARFFNPFGSRGSRLNHYKNVRERTYEVLPPGFGGGIMGFDGFACDQFDCRFSWVVTTPHEETCAEHHDGIVYK